tara:strand:- start:243 stop:1199 length:957 start_codon:yes stop_codon:yes gene_type:complete
MWLKSMKWYRVTPPEGKTGQDWEEGLAQQLSQTCPKNMTLSYGWESPFRKSDKSLVASVGEYHAVHFCLSTRLLPQDVVRQTVAERVAEIEASQGMPVPKKEQRRMQDEVHFELLPKAFVQKKTIPVLWDSASGLLLVGATQAAVLESLVTCWAYCLPGWKLKPVTTQSSPERMLTRWLNQDEPMPQGLAWGDACQLIDPQDRYCSIRFAGNELTSPSVKQHMADGMMVKQASIQWHDKLKLTLSGDGQMTQIKTLDMDAEYEKGQSLEEQVMMDLALMAPLYRLCVQEIIAALEGEEKTAQSIGAKPCVESYSDSLA